MQSLRSMATLALWFSIFDAGQMTISSRTEANQQYVVKQKSVFGERRSTESDVLITADGDRLYGVLVNEVFHLRTPYTSMVLKTRRLAGLTFNTEPLGRTAIVSILGDRFTGYLSDGPLRFVRDDGIEMQIERHFVSKVILAVRPGEDEGFSLSNRILAGDSDEFHGRVIDPRFRMSTRYATLPVVLDDVRLMRIRGKYGGRTEIEFVDGKRLSGGLDPMKFDVLLDIGGRITIDTCAVGLTKLE